MREGKWSLGVLEVAQIMQMLLVSMRGDARGKVEVTRHLLHGELSGNVASLVVLGLELFFEANHLALLHPGPVGESPALGGVGGSNLLAGVATLIRLGLGSVARSAVVGVVQKCALSHSLGVGVFTQSQRLAAENVASLIQSHLGHIVIHALLDLSRRVDNVESHQRARQLGNVMLR